MPSHIISRKDLVVSDDLTFKPVFAEHKDLMMSLLNALLPLAENAPIESIEYFPYAFKFLT